MDYINITLTINKALVIAFWEKRNTLYGIKTPLGLEPGCRFWRMVQVYGEDV